MILDVLPHDAQTTARILESVLIAKSLRLSTYERQALTDFLSELQQALDEEAERQYIANINGDF